MCGDKAALGSPIEHERVLHDRLGKAAEIQLLAAIGALYLRVNARTAAQFELLLNS